MGTHIRKPSDIVRTMELAVSFLLIIFLSFLVLGFFPISHPRLTKFFVDEIKKNGIDSICVEKVEIVAWKGITAHYVTFQCKMNPEASVAIDFKKATIGGNVVKLVGHYVLKWRDKSESLAIFYKSNPIEGAKKTLSFFSDSKSIKSIDIAKLNIVSDDSVSNFECVNTDLRFSGVESTHIAGTFSMSQLNIRNIFPLVNVKGEFTADQDGVAVSKTKGKLFGGKFKVEGKIDPFNKRFEGLRYEISQMSLEHYFSYTENDSIELSGLADITLELDPSPMHIDSVIGTGSVQCFDLVASNTVLQKSMAAFFMVPYFDTLVFNKFKSRFVLKGGGLAMVAIEGEGSSMAFKSDGWIHREGTLNQELELLLDEALIAKSPLYMIDSMEKNKDNKRVFQCRVYGSLESPKLEIESSLMKRAVGNVFHSMKKGLENLFK